MMNPQFDPYEAISELQTVTALLDGHINALLENQTQIVKAFNSISDRLDKIEEKLDATTTKNR